MVYDPSGVVLLVHKAIRSGAVTCKSFANASLTFLMGNLGAIESYELLSVFLAIPMNMGP